MSPRFQVISGGNENAGVGNTLSGEPVVSLAGVTNPSERGDTPTEGTVAGDGIVRGPDYARGLEGMTGPPVVSFPKVLCVAGYQEDPQAVKLAGAVLEAFFEEGAVASEVMRHLLGRPNVAV